MQAADSCIAAGEGVCALVEKHHTMQPTRHFTPLPRVTPQTLDDQFRRLLLVLPVEAAAALSVYVVEKKRVKFFDDFGGDRI